MEVLEKQVKDNSQLRESLGEELEESQKGKQDSVSCKLQDKRIVAKRRMGSVPDNHFQCFHLLKQTFCGLTITLMLEHALSSTAIRF